MALFNFNDIVFKSITDARKVLHKLEALVSLHGYATVEDLYDVSYPFTDIIREHPSINNKYGWYDIGFVKIDKAEKGFLLKLPRPMFID